MIITVRLFAALREAAGKDMLKVDIPAGMHVEEAVRRVRAQLPALDPFASVIRTAVNDDWATPDRVLRDGDEVALLSPVSGG